MPVPDIFRDGLARGWTTYNGARLDKDLLLCLIYDVLISNLCTSQR